MDRSPVPDDLAVINLAGLEKNCCGELIAEIHAGSLRSSFSEQRRQDYDAARGGVNGNVVAQ